MRATRIHVLISSVIMTVSPAIAQTTAPATAPAADMGWIWIVLLLAAAVGAAVWYFMFRKRSSGTSSGWR